MVAGGIRPPFSRRTRTAAGTVPPAEVVVLGAGVAGLQAIATARRLGAVVKAYDVRAAAAEEIRSVGGQPIDRKSTRLNSSHANISYAVFCLKTKYRIQASA